MFPVRGWVTQRDNCGVIGQPYSGVHAWKALYKACFPPHAQAYLNAGPCIKVCISTRLHFSGSLSLSEVLCKQTSTGCAIFLNYSANLFYGSELLPWPTVANSPSNIELLWFSLFLIYIFYSICICQKTQ